MFSVHGDTFGGIPLFLNAIHLLSLSKEKYEYQWLLCNDE